jgi:hypothetical protein
MALLVLVLATACDDADEPFPGCPGEERVPAFCAGEADERCTCNTCELNAQGEARCVLVLTQSSTTCRPDGSDWATCGCPAGPPRAECLAACETMRCTEACDERSALSCMQRCQDFFEQYQARRGAPNEPCATAIATYAVCMPEYGCPSAPPCVGHADWDPLRDLYLAECGGP